MSPQSPPFQFPCNPGLVHQLFTKESPSLVFAKESPSSFLCYHQRRIPPPPWMFAKVSLLLCVCKSVATLVVFCPCWKPRVVILVVCCSYWNPWSSMIPHLVHPQVTNMHAKQTRRLPLCLIHLPMQQRKRKIIFTKHR